MTENNKIMHRSSRINVLVFPGGTEIGLEICKALSNNKNINLFSAGSNTSNHAPFIFKNHFIVPSVYEDNWISSLNRIIEGNSIHYIFPGHDDVITALACHASEIDAKVVSSPVETSLVCRSKTASYELFKNCIPVPQQFFSVEEVSSFPVFVKPDRGQGSQNTHLVFSKDELYRLLEDKDKEYIILEYLPGEEYTIDCFSDREKGLLFCGGRKRYRIRNGISMNCKPIQDPTFFEVAKKISQKLVFHGAWFFQLRKDQRGELKLLEIAPRIAGTMALHRVLGVNFPLLSIYEQERIPITILKNNIDIEIDRALINRYKAVFNFKVLYVDLDDTLVVNESVNLDLIRFIYQCINDGKRIVLITKHPGDLFQYLNKFRLTGLFDDIFQLRPDEQKTNFINEVDSIFIDDSFSERFSVHQSKGIPTFDCSMLEMLLDDRV